MVMVVTLVVAVACAAAAVDQEPHGVVAVSSGRTVTLLDPSGTSPARTVQTGAVRRLYPGPAGVLFAPDFEAAETVVIDAAVGQVESTLDGITMPIFGLQTDRYIVVAGDLLVVSYPSRSLLAVVEAGLARPWRTVMGPDGRYAMVLERGVDSSVVTVVDVWQALVQSRHRLSGSVADMVLLSTLGALALGDDGGGVRIVEPATFAVLAEWKAPAAVRAVATFSKGVVVGLADGTLVVLEVKTAKRKVEVRVRRQARVSAGVHALDSSTEGDRVVVLADDGEVSVLTPGNGHLGALASVTGSVRDVVWMDVGRRGPLRPLWSDENRGGPASVGVE